MDIISSADEARRRRRVMVAIGDALRDLRSELSGLNHRVGARVDLKDGDLECLDLLDRHDSLTPSELARRAGVHPATITGVLDRLERGGWILRERSPDDRRADMMRPTRHRIKEMLGLYSGMNRRLQDICEQYSERELILISEFLRQASEAGRGATEELSYQDP